MSDLSSVGPNVVAGTTSSGRGRAAIAARGAGGRAAAPVAPGLARRIPPKHYRIGEVAEYSGVSRQTIHNYTTMGLIREARWTPGGHRLYDETVFARLDHIEALKADRKSLEFIRERFAALDAR